MIARLARELGFIRRRYWIRQDQADAGERTDRPTVDMVEENRRLRQEVAELRRVDEILKATSSYFALTSSTAPCSATRRPPVATGGRLRVLRPTVVGSSGRGISCCLGLYGFRYK